MESARLRVAVLASGSKGNAALIEFGDTSILLDCGLGVAQLKKRLSLIGRSPTDITAMLVTHEHGDHCAGAAAVSSRFGLPVWMTPGTAEALNGKQFARTVRFNCHANIQIGELVIEPIPVPHDAREPCQFLFRAHDRRVAWLTDLGHVSAHVARVAAGCNGLLLEF
ncbi:MAG: MBL fold metallo-hydrolase, partial [Chromatiales bacterium]|nr:MBL fold metallo-hydrolase [Chromatiales bacterium]